MYATTSDRIDTLIPEIRRTFQVDALRAGSSVHATAEAALTGIRTDLLTLLSNPALPRGPDSTPPPSLVNHAKMLFYSQLVVTKSAETAAEWLKLASTRPGDFSPFVSIFDTLPASLKNPPKRDQKQKQQPGKKPWWKRARERRQQQRGGGGHGGDGRSGGNSKPAQAEKKDQ